MLQRFMTFHQRMYYYCRLFVTLALTDEGTEERHGRVVGHELRSIGIVQALADVLHDGSLGMKLYVDGTFLVGALNALYRYTATKRIPPGLSSWQLMS